MGHATPHRYLIALGSNQRHVRHGRPRQVLLAALQSLSQVGCEVEAVSSIIDTAPIGPSQRRYANAAAVIATFYAPDALLMLLKRIEQQFGARKGQRWSKRVLDMDIILWSGGSWQSNIPHLTIPHRLFRQRDFVLKPARDIAPDWRDSGTGLTISQLYYHGLKEQNQR